MAGLLAYLILGVALAPLAPLVVWVGGIFRRNWRRSWPARFGLTPRRDDRPVVVWCASVGEVSTAQRFIRALLAGGGAPVLLAVYTPDGLARAKELENLGTRYSSASPKFPTATLAPVDSYLFASLWLRRVRPRAALLFETEIWPAFVVAANRRHVPLGVINGRVSDRAYPRYRLLRRFWRPVLRRLDLVSVQTADYAARFRELGARADAAAVSGSLKFDVDPPSPPAEAVRAVYEAFVAGRRAIVAGSTHEGEEKIAAEAVRALRAEFPDAVLLVAPRHLQRADEAAAEIRQAGLKLARRSTATVAEAASAEALLIDVLGELAWAYSLGVAAFVGGSFGDRGGQGRGTTRRTRRRDRPVGRRSAGRRRPAARRLPF